MAEKKKRRQFTKEFRAEAVRLVRESGKPVSEVARDIDVTETSLYAILVDNGSTDDSIPFVRERFPSVRVIRHNRDRGLGAAFETALSHARGDYLAFLDNHTRVEPSWIRELVEATSREGCTSTMRYWLWSPAGSSR